MKDLKKLALTAASAAAFLICGLIVFQTAASAEGAAQTVVELRNNSPIGHTIWSEFGHIRINGTDNKIRKEYRFQRIRQGKNFSYVLANLRPSCPYWVELSFVEPEHERRGERVFNVYLQGSRVLERFDILGASGGKYTACQRLFSTRSDAKGRLYIQFRSDEAGCAGNAAVSTIRILRGASTEVLEIGASSSRSRMNPPIRFRNNETQNCYEALLGRLGSRFFLNLAAQRLGVRFSPLGTGTADLSELVMAIRIGDAVRALPFTDRYPAWESISQKHTMTSCSFSCSSRALPVRFSARFRSPFYPRDETLSSAPFIYVDLTLNNTGNSTVTGDFLLAIPHKYSFSSSMFKRIEDSVLKGYSYTDRFHYYDESLNSAESKVANIGLCVPAADSEGVELKGLSPGEFADFTPGRLWELTSPSGYPLKSDVPSSPLFTFFPRGYSGIRWRFESLAPGKSVTRRIVLAGYVSEPILNVRNASYEDSSFRYKYTSRFEDVLKVAEYAVESRDELVGKSSFFDLTIASNDNLYMSPSYLQDFRDFTAYAFQSFLVNTWWAKSERGREWFSVWEGTCCRFHSTVDVEYNNAWFYYQFFPELLKRIMDQWLLYLKTCPEGTYLSHDMGWGDFAGGQKYPHDMPVEENANFILLLYKYWKVTGDSSYVESRFPHVRKFVDFMARCDTNNDGLPDMHTANTLDQSSYAIQFSKDQTYLGVKCLGAYRAAMRLSELSRDWKYYHKCISLVEQINQTLERESWVGDHFAVSLDGSCPDVDREAYHIYSPNGVVYLLSADLVTGLSASNLSRMAGDIEIAARKTARTYGCAHSSHDINNQWISQNLWRDMAALALKVPVLGRDPLFMVKRYWEAQLQFARYLNGGFWDVVIYSQEEVRGASGSARGGPDLPEKTISGRCACSRVSTVSGAKGISQSLGYYPRGAAVFGLIPFAAGVSLDVPGGVLTYSPFTTPLKIPLFERADWKNPNPDKRIPVLRFSREGKLKIKNAELLPARIQKRKMLSVGIASGVRHAISPGSDIVGESEVSFEIPAAGRASTDIWDGRARVRASEPRKVNAEKISFRWDGRNARGESVSDGLYRVRTEVVPDDRLNTVLPGSTDMWVNRNIPNLSRRWYLAEGYTGRSGNGRFETFVLIQNPGSQRAEVKVEFMLPGGEVQRRSYTISPSSRFTIRVNDILPDREMSTCVISSAPVIVERAMYFNDFRAGHAAAGITFPSERWYLAEGYTANGFDEYILVQNPGQEEATLTVTYMTPAMGNLEKKYRVEPFSRFTIHVNKVLPSREVSAMIVSSKPVVVERAQYLNEMRSGTCSQGAVSLSRTWYLAEGYTADGFEEYILIQNPNREWTSVRARYMRNDGSTTLRCYELPPRSRFTIGVNEVFPDSEVSVRINASRPVVVERAMYWNRRSDGHVCLGTPTPDTAWYLAEGYTGAGFETWILVQNPSPAEAEVMFTFMESSGKTISRTFEVKPQSRFTVSGNRILPGKEFSVAVTSKSPLIVERAVYFNNRSGGTCAHGIRGADLP